MIREEMAMGEVMVIVLAFPAVRDSLEIVSVFPEEIVYETLLMVIVELLLNEDAKVSFVA